MQDFKTLWNAYGYIFLLISHIIPKVGIVSMNIVIIVKMRKTLRKHLLRANPDYYNNSPRAKEGLSTVSQVGFKILHSFWKVIKGPIY